MREENKNMSGQKSRETGAAEGPKRKEIQLVEKWSWRFAGEVTWEPRRWGGRQQKMGWQGRRQCEF